MRVDAIQIRGYTQKSGAHYLGVVPAEKILLDEVVAQIWQLILPAAIRTMDHGFAWVVFMIARSGHDNQPFGSRAVSKGQTV